MTEQPGSPLTTGEGNTALDDVLMRVERAYLNEIAETRQAQPEYSAEEIERVCSWLAGVSFNEWFALAADRDRLREQLDALATSLEQKVAGNKQGPDMGWTHPDEPADQLRREVGYVIEDARAAAGDGQP